MPTQTAFALGHVHLKVRQLDRSVEFYTQTFGFTVSETVADQYAFLSDGSVHHIVALQAVGDGAPAPHPYGVGLYHAAFEVPTKDAFAGTYLALRETGLPIAVVDHRISWAMYFDDPDGNGLEIYVDTRRDAPGTDSWHGVSRRLSEKEILAAIDGRRSRNAERPGT